MNKLILTILIPLITILATIEAEETTVPTFTLNTINESNITFIETKQGFDIVDFKGHAVLLVLFGHRCPPCLKEIPEFIELTDKHEENLSIIAIESQNYPLESVKEFAKEHKINYNIVAGVNHGDFISYLAGRAGYENGVPLPLLIAIDKQGEVKDIRPGQLSKEELELLIKNLNE